MVREYELMYIVRPELDDDGVRAATESVQSLVENVGGQVTKTTPWGKRRLAYEVQHLRDGHYVLAQLRLEATRVTDLERALRISDTVFRHLLVVNESVGAADESGGAADESGGAADESGAPAAAEASANGAATAEPAGADVTAPDAAESPAITRSANTPPTAASAASIDEEV